MRRVRERGPWWRTAAALVLAFGLEAHAAAQAARSPVAVTVEGLFGEGTLLGDGYAPVLVTLESRAGRDFTGELELRLESYEAHIVRHVAAVDLPRGARRQIVVTMFLDSNASQVVARYGDGERVLGQGAGNVAYASGARTVVVLGDPPRLRGALLELDVEDATPAGPRLARTNVGTVRLDPSSGDPMLPTEPAGWAPVRVLVASAHVLARASEPQRAALHDWLRTGGRLLVFPRTPGELADPWLRGLAGEVGAEPTSEVAALVPAGVERFALSCGAQQRAESFGCSAPVGFGRVYLASYDGTSVPALESGVPRELVRSVYAATEPAGTALVFGRHRDTLAHDYYYGSGASFGALRAALDPNEAFRPALVLVALVLLLYVIVVGPINFRWVQRKNRPTLALLTTPAAALSCVALLLVVGYLGKGVAMRYRRVEIVEAMEGEARAPARRYTGLYATRPGSFELDPMARGEIAHRIEASGDRGPVHRHEGDGVRLADFRAGLWETVFLREDRVVELGGAIRFERDGRRMAQVVNDSALALSNAFVVDDAGAIYPVGDVAPHGRAEIARVARGSLVPAPYYDDAAAVSALSGAIGAGSDDRPYVRGILRLVGSVPPPVGGAPILYARVPTRPSLLGGTFAPETDQRWIRVVPRLRGRPILPAAPPVDPTDPMRNVELAPSGEDESASSDEGIHTDAGAGAITDTIEEDAE